MTRKEKFREDAFIARWIAGELSDNENREFEQWVYANPAERHYFDDLKTIWSDYGSIKLSAGLTKEERWQTICARTYIKTGSLQSRRTGTNWTWSAVALSAVLIFVAFYLWSRAQPVTVVTSRGERIGTKLPDGSTVNLNAKSTITYREHGWHEKREVQLVGEAVFEVIRGDAPFRVKTAFSTIEVTGTRFHIKERGNTVEIACVSGRVSVTSNEIPDRTVTLRAGLASLVVQGTQPSPPYDFEPDQKIGWTRDPSHRLFE